MTKSWGFPVDTTRVEVTATGLVSIERSSVSTGLQPFGQMRLASFPSREGLKQSSPKYFAESCASGPPLIAAPEARSVGGTLIIGVLEEDVAAGAVGTVISPKWHVPLR